ncbi:MAG: glycoside hydrolase 100 family protein [Gammaproteobacteria bacterium]|jgi:glycogen debranching enzyme
MKNKVIGAARDLLQSAIMCSESKPVGTAAAVHSTLEAPNYAECFVRDFVPSALVFLMEKDTEIVKNFLQIVVDLRDQQPVMEGHERAVGLMPASFHVSQHNGDQPTADFGDRAIGRVAPVDSAMWWMILLRAYVNETGDRQFACNDAMQESIRSIMQLYLKESFETSPAMLVPDASFMIDRRMGVYGHPLEIQALFYGMLQTALELLKPEPQNERLLVLCKKRLQTLRSYVRIYYWLDRQRLNEIHRYNSEEFGLDAINVLNIYPESIPEWIDGWIPENAGYLVGNLGPGRMDFRYFAMGNLLAILFGLATDDQATRMMNLYDTHWDTLVGHMPLKICYPAVSGERWAYTTGSDRKNVPWSYHNGGHWPCLLWAFVGAAVRVHRYDLAKRAIETAMEKLPMDKWPEYYDGKTGSLIGRRANFYQTWSATGLIVAHRLMEDPDSRGVLQAISF